MRIPSSLLVSFLLVGALSAQQPAAKQTPVAPVPTAPAIAPPQAPAPQRSVTFDPERDPLDKILFQWEQKMKGLKSYIAAVTKTETDTVENSKTVYEGAVKLLRPNRAELYLVRKGNPQIYERYLCTGNYLYEFRPQQKLVRVHTLPQKPGGQPALDEGFLGFLFGLDGKDLKNRYEIKLMRQDQYYAYLYIKPILPGDRAEFSEARLALLLSTMMPAQMIFVPPNGTEVVWTLGPADPNKVLGPADFAPPNQLPKDWQMQQVPPLRVAGQAPTTTPTTTPAGAAPGVPTSVPPSKVRPNGN